MNIKKNFWTALFYIINFSLCSCTGNIFVNNVSETSPKNYLVNSYSSDTTEVDTRIVETVENFWKASKENDKKNLMNYIQQVPESFWTDCPSVDSSENDIFIEESSIESKFPKGRGIGISSSEKQGAFFLLEYFSEQIQKNKLELIKTRIIKSSANEAVVKIDWRTSKSGLGWLSQSLLLYKFETGWKIFMITNPIELKKYNENFAENKECSQNQIK